MAQNKSWYQRLNPFSSGEDTEVKALKEQFDTVVGELNDEAFTMKFMDAEPSQFNSAFGADFGGIDQQIDTAALQRLYSTETWVYTAVTAIAKTIAGLPNRIERRKTIQREIVNEYTNEKETVKQDIWIDASGEKMNQLFARPNEWTTRAELFMLLAIDLLTAGEYYLFMDSDEDLTTLENSNIDQNSPTSPFGRLMAAMANASPIKALYRIPPFMIKPIPNPDKSYVAGYMMQSEKGTYSFNIAEIIHVKLPNPNDPFHGQSPLVAAFKPTLLDRFTTEHMVRFYKAGARLGGVITTDKSLNKEQLGRFQRSFESNFTGRHNHHRTLILPPGMSYNMIEQNPAETALLEFCRYNRDAILSVYNVPPIKVGVMDKANYANALVQLKIFFSDTIMPLLTFFEDGFNCKQTLMPYSGNYRFKFDISQVEALKENFKEKAEAAKFMMEGGLTINEIRRQVWQKGPIDGGDKCKALVDISKPDTGGLIAASATPGVQKADATVPQPDATLINSGTNTKLTFGQRVAQLVRLFMDKDKLSLDVATEQAIAQATLEGYNSDKPVTASQPAQSVAEPKDGATAGPSAATGGIGTAQNPELIPTLVGPGKPKKPEDDDKTDKPSLADFISEMVEKLDSDEEITPEFIQELIKAYEEKYGNQQPETQNDTSKDTGAAATVQTVTPDTAPTQAVIQDARPIAFGFSKEHLSTAHKAFHVKTDPLVQKRLGVVQRWFKSFGTVVTSRLGANLKAYGLHKSRDSDDIDDILNLEGYQKLIKQFISEIDEVLDDAYKMGYSDTLATFVFGEPSKAAAAFLKKYAAGEVTKITDTTMDQMRELLTAAFEAKAPVNEIASQIQEKFTEISHGRAMTIARTETLTAVSYGRQEKREEWQKQFPEKSLVKIWVGSGKEHAREWHADMTGESVPVDEAFSNNLMFPRDQDGPPEETINCGCTDITADEDSADSIKDTLTDDTPTAAAEAADSQQEITTTASDDAPEDTDDT